MSRLYQPPLKQNLILHQFSLNIGFCTLVRLFFFCRILAQIPLNIQFRFIPARLLKSWTYVHRDMSNAKSSSQLHLLLLHILNKFLFYNLQSSARFKQLRYKPFFLTHYPFNNSTSILHPPPSPCNANFVFAPVRFP